LSRATSKEKVTADSTQAFSRVAGSDVAIRIVLALDKAAKGISKEDLFTQSSAGNDGIFQYNISELVRLRLVSADSSCVLTNLGKEMARRLRSVLP
jgi:hypothetical protein